MPWAKRQSRPIPRISSKTLMLEMNDYSQGMDSYVSNDKFPVKPGGTNLWRLAQDARIPALGEYETRRGFNFYTEAAEATQDQAISATTGAADQSFNTVTRLAQSFVASATGGLTEIDLNIKNDASAQGTPVVAIYTNVAGKPGVFVAATSVSSVSVGSSYAYLKFRFASAPAITASSTYWIVAYVQANSSGSYKWSSTTSATTALTSSDSGATWSAASFALNFKQIYAPVSGVKGLFREYKSDGTKVTVLAHNTSLYSVNDATGVLTAIKTGLNAASTFVRFEFVNDVLYYVNGYDGYRKYDGTTETQITSTNYTLIKEHKGLMFLQESTDPNKLSFTNFADYETFTSTDFVYVPSPKTGDPTTALESLNGYLLIFTLNNKFILSGTDNATFSLDEAPDQNGTFTQETVTKDNNYVYYLSQDGVYRSNGSEAHLMSEHNYQEVLTLAHKESAVLCINRGRLYMWYQSATSGVNDSCYVWNLNFSSGDSDNLESIDTTAYVSRAFSAFKDDNALLVASSMVGQAYWQEASSNEYDNLGAPINYELDTHYFTTPSPAVLKEVRYWEPRFAAQSGNYTVECEYAYDRRNNWQTQSSFSVQGSGPVWGSGIQWGAFTWGIAAEAQAYLTIPGEYRRIAVRYKHYAMRQPVKFLGHTLQIQSRRLR